MGPGPTSVWTVGIMSGKMEGKECVYLPGRSSRRGGSTRVGSRYSTNVTAVVCSCALLTNSPMGIDTRESLVPPQILLSPIVPVQTRGFVRDLFPNPSFTLHPVFISSTLPSSGGWTSGPGEDPLTRRPSEGRRRRRRKEGRDEGSGNPSNLST